MRTLQAALLCLLPLLGWGQSDDMAPLLKRLENSTWVAAGPRHSERVAYVFTDMACPYCAQLWQNMAPMLEAPNNTLQVRHIIVGLVHPKRSFTQGAAILRAPDPAGALAYHESHFDAGGIPPLQIVPPAVRSQIHNNTGLMLQLNLPGTPAMLFEDQHGEWRLVGGVVSNQALREQVFRLE